MCQNEAGNSELYDKTIPPTKWRSRLLMAKECIILLSPIIGGSKAGAMGACPPVQILSFSCSFRENFGQIIGWHPHLEVGAPPSHLRNPGSATANDVMQWMEWEKVNQHLVPFPLLPTSKYIYVGYLRWIHGMFSSEAPKTIAPHWPFKRFFLLLRCLCLKGE